MCTWVLSHSVVSDSLTPWTIARQVLLSMEFPRHEHRSGLLFPPPGHLSDPEIEPESLASPALAGGFFTTVPPGKLCLCIHTYIHTYTGYAGIFLRIFESIFMKIFILFMYVCLGLVCVMLDSK